MKPNRRLKAEEHVVLWRPPVDEIDEALELPVIYRDDHLLVIDKPPNITVHPTARHYHLTVIKTLQQRYPGQHFSLIHRLDRDTSGVLLLALSSEADRAFKMLFEGRTLNRAGQIDTVKKTYLAIVKGNADSGLIDLPLERDETNAMKVKMKVAVTGKGLESKTRVRVLGHTDKYSLLECELLTGRQHQIRVHLAALGNPVVGDKLYGPDERLLARAADGELTAGDHELLELPRHALHAHSYELPHAVTGAPLVLRAELPKDMAEFWREQL